MQDFISYATNPVTIAPISSYGHGTSQSQRKKHHAGIHEWQYDQIIKELLLLQEHQTDPTCPCSTDGEMCVRKHLMTIKGYAQETIPMEEDESYKDKLKDLAVDAQTYRQQEEEILRREGQHVTLIEWTRNWRKEFEDHSLVTGASEDENTQE